VQSQLRQDALIWY